jgi:rare lipoprotein A
MIVERMGDYWRLLHTVVTTAVLPAVQATIFVVASWYGPGFYGNHTACGQMYTPESVGVAHKSLPCGTLVTIDHNGNQVTVPVIDRGPYIVGRTFDLSPRVKAMLGCTDLCTIGWKQ